MSCAPDLCLAFPLTEESPEEKKRKVFRESGRNLLEFSFRVPICASKALMKISMLVLAGVWLAPMASAGSLPTITTFAAAPTTVAAGQSSILVWAVTGATSLRIDPSLGAVTGTSVKVSPKATSTYTLTATNAFGSRTATAIVTIGSPPTITNFAATPTMVAAGQSSTLSWAVTGATSLRIDPVVGAVTGTSVKVSPTATATYTLTATNAFGSRTAMATIMAGSPPTITSFVANPAKVTSGQSSTLSWTVTGSPGLIINPGVGAVTGTSVKVSPSATTAYTLTATNSFGIAHATVTVAAGSPPSISIFWTNPNMAAGPGVSVTLIWATTGATSLSIDHGVGTVTGSSVSVSPTAKTTYTLTATNAMGSVTATATVNYIPLTKVTTQLYYSEHALFIIPTPGQVIWTGANSWDSVYSTANVNSYVATLKSVFHDDFSFVVVAANNLLPNNVPVVQPARHTADGIGLGSTGGVGVPSICRYNIGGGTVIPGAFGVLDHEIGHNWGVFLGDPVANTHGHWFSNSTASGQMAEFYSDDAYTTDKLISGDPINGFTWRPVNHLTWNETETFDLHDLYLQGLTDTFPDLYVLNSPVYNPDQSVTYSSVVKFDQTALEQKFGVRYPSYRTSDKRFRVAFVYVARDMAEVLAAYQPIERSASHFVDAEQIDTTNFRFQVPFLVDTQYRASLNALLADLDGNRTPTLSIVGSTDLVSGDGSAVVPFTAADADGTVPVVSCVPASANCSISGKNVVLTGLPSGAHFFTIKAQDAAGKKAFTHFVVDVQ